MLHCVWCVVCRAVQRQQLCVLAVCVLGVCGGAQGQQGQGQGQGGLGEEEGLPAYDELIYVANSEKLNSDKILRFLEAVELATQYIINHPQDSWEIFASTSSELRDELNRLAWQDTLPRFALRPAALDLGRYQRFETFLVQAGLLKKTQPASQLAVDLTSQ